MALEIAKYWGAKFFPHLTETYQLLAIEAVLHSLNHGN